MQKDKIPNIYTNKLSVLEILVNAVFLLFIAVITTGTLDKMSDITIANDRNDSLVLLIVFFAVIILAEAVFVVFRLIDKTDDRRQMIISAVILCLYALVVLFLTSIITSKPHTDSLHNIETAWYLIDHKLSEDFAHIKYIKAYSNNYLLTILTKYIISIALRINADPLSLLTAVNAVMLFIGLVLGFYAIKKNWGIKAANKALFLMAVNPMYWYLNFWVYSASVSIPVMMGIIALLPYSGRGRADYLRSAAIGVLLPVGYYIRPTAVFPFLAFCALLVLRICRSDSPLLKKENLKKLAIKAGTCSCVLILAAGLTGAAINHMIDNTFGEYKQYNLPVTYWLNIGSQGNGDLGGFALAETIYAKDQYSDIETDSSYYVGLAANHYKANGIAGTIGLFYRKAVKTFSNGFSEVVGRAFNGECLGWKCEILKGPLMAIYAYAYRMILNIGLCIYVISILFLRKDKDFLGQLLAISLLGGIVFYMIWEAKGDYSLPFNLIMAGLAYKGYSMVDAQSAARSFTDKVALKPLLCAAAVSVLCCTVVLTAVLQEICDRDRAVIQGNVSGLVNEDELVFIDGNIEQSFKCKKAFNRLSFDVVSESDFSNSSFEIQLLNNKGNCVYSNTINNTDEQPVIAAFNSVVNSSVNNIEMKGYLMSKLYSKGSSVVQLPKALPAGKYRLKITDLNENKDLYFLTSNNYYLDTYEGELTVDGEAYSDDLSMSVSRFKQWVHFIPGRRRRYTCIAFLLASLAVTILFIRELAQLTGRRIFE